MSTSQPEGDRFQTFRFKSETHRPLVFRAIINQRLDNPPLVAFHGQKGKTSRVPKVSHLRAGFAFDTNPTHSYSQAMTVELTVEQEAQLSELAVQAGRDVDDLAREAVDLYIAEEQRFHAAVRAGQLAASEGRFVPASEVWRGVETELNS
jgi:predicted transcriptional regulator